MKKYTLTLFILLYSFVQVNAQRFPITVIPQVNPPAPVNFHNYADRTTINSPLRVQLLLSDITILNEQIRLKVFFEGNGINFESRDVVLGAAPLFIDGGVPLVLTNAELAPYFEFQNIRGINQNVYGSTIPEGSYQFCFEVYDASTGNRLSSKTCISTYIFKNEPPILNTPFNKTNIEPKEVDNIVFQWTPRHINVSNVEYELSIVEIWDNVVDPQTAFLSVPPIFETTTRSTSFVYGPAQPLLLPDKRYAWRVRAKALQGAEEIGLFRNEGKSEIFWFSRTSPCDAPLNIYAEQKGISKINVFWDEDPVEYSEYTIAYREANKPNANWFTMRTNSGWATVWDLKPGTTYEYKVRGKCKYQYGPYSEPQEITTETVQDETANYNCGIVPDAIAITNREPHADLRIGDRVTAGDFVMTITELDGGSGGRISGKGYVRVPYLKFARFSVKFEGILVNTDNQLAEGEIVTLYDPEFGEGEDMTVDVDLDVIEMITGDQGELSSAEVDFVIADITQNENNAWVITGTNGEQAIVPGDQEVVIRDQSGTAYTIGEDGTVTREQVAEGGPATDSNTEGINGGNATEVTAIGVNVEFLNSGYYTFDALPEAVKEELASEYKTLTVASGEDYVIPYKAISKIKGGDIVKAEVTFEDDSFTKEDIIFKTKEGIEVPVTWNDNVATLSIKNKSDYLIEEILATVKPKKESEQYTIAGALQLVHLGNQQLANINLVIIPVNDAKVPSNIKGELNQIYNKAGVGFNVNIGARLQISESAWDDGNGILDIGDSGLFSYYTNEEKEIINYFKTNGAYKDDTYFLFITDVPISKLDVQGFMPLKSQFGFIFGNSSHQNTTIAHELGHGVFGLEHPFSEYETNEKATDFLMDYNNGEVLSHMDWKKMHAPGFKLYWFQGDEDGESSNPYVDDNTNTCDISSISSLDQKNLEELKRISKNIDTETASHIEETINKIEKFCLLQQLEYTELVTLLRKLGIQNSIPEDHEKAILKLLSSISVEKHSDVHDDLLAQNNYSLLKNLLKRMNDEFAFYGDDNRTYFTEILAGITSNNNDDDEKWNVLNLIVKERFDDLEKREQQAFQEILLSLDEYKELQDAIPVISNLFTEMLIDGCENLDSYKIIFDIAIKRNQNREAFARFTQSERRAMEKDNYFFEHIGSLNWILPYDIMFKNAYFDPVNVKAEDFYQWPNLLMREFSKADYRRDEIIASELNTSQNSLQYFQTFIRVYDDFLNAYEEENSRFWPKYDGNEGLVVSELAKILDHINLNENVNSLTKVKESIRLAVFEAILTDKKIEDDDLDAIYKDIHNDALMKLALSFSYRRRSVIRAIEDVGFKQIYKQLSGDRLSKFLAWVGQYVVETNYVESLTLEEVEDMDQASQSDFDDDDNILQLEANIFQFDNFSSKFIDNKTISANGKSLPYNKMVLVYVADDFTFLGQEFKKGSVLNIPIIHAFAISNSNWNTVAGKSAWLAADVLSFAIGVGAIKVVFTTGNIIRKAIVVSDVAGSAIGGVATALNESAVSKEVRTNMHILSIMTAVPSLAMNIQKVDALVARTDKAIDGLSGLNDGTRATLKAFLKDFKTPSFRANSIITNIKKSRPNCK